MRPEDVIALMRKFRYDDNKINNSVQPQYNLRLPHTTRNEGLCTSIEAALFAFGRLSEDGGQHIYNPELSLLIGKMNDNHTPIKQAICVFQTDLKYHSIGFLHTPRSFHNNTGNTYQRLVLELDYMLDANEIKLQSILKLNPKCLSKLRRDLRDAQSSNQTHTIFNELIPTDEWIRSNR